MLHAEEQLIHDLRNAASVIRGASQHLAVDQDELSPEAVRSLAEMISRRSDMLVRLLGDLDLVRQLESGDVRVSLQRVELAEVCEFALAEARPSDGSPAGTTITMDVPEGLAVIGDPVRVTQVLDNLVTNALRYGGPNMSVSASRAGPLVHLDVRDDGSGIPADLVEELFDVYSRGPDSDRVGGSGLGLAIVRELCAAMDGSVTYDGEDGCRFRITLLAAAPGAEALDDADSPLGHSAMFWQDADVLGERLTTFVRVGLAAGEAVVVAARQKHLDLLVSHLRAAGVEVDRLLASGQLVPVEAASVHQALTRDGHIDRPTFDRLVGATLERVLARWSNLRAFGEIVDLYWHQGDPHLALELESCWEGLLRAHPFRLLCAYELGSDESVGEVFDCHDDVLFATA